jgi:predicted nucleic acid-binding protein
MIQVAGLLDTNILVDTLRAYSPAVQWMQQNPHLMLAIPALVRMEMVLGAENKKAQEAVIKLMKPFPVLYPSESDAQWAMEQFEIFHLSHQVEIIDCFFAAMGVRLGLPIYTRNTKDLGVIGTVTLHVPYQ